jgi:hypothetical protein
MEAQRPDQLRSIESGVSAVLENGRQHRRRGVRLMALSHVTENMSIVSSSIAMRVGVLIACLGMWKCCWVWRQFTSLEGGRSDIALILRTRSSLKSALRLPLLVHGFHEVRIKFENLENNGKKTRTETYSPLRIYALELEVQALA